MASSLRNAALYLAVIQFCFSLTWIVYVVYLGDLLESVGIGRDKLLWFVLLDQLVFALTDTLMGFYADRMGRALRRIGPMILGVNAVSCLAFVLLPLIAVNGDNVGSQILWVALLVVWIGTSSVLRAPPIVLLMKHAAKPQVPWLASLVVIGLALGGAASPYLGLILKQISPFVPFLLAGATLLLTTVGLIWMERLLESQPVAVDSVEPIPKRYFWPMLWSLLGVGLFLGLGFQVHNFLNTKARFLEFAAPEMLVWLVPVFWIGFHVFVFPGAAVARRVGVLDVMLLAAPLGVFGLAFVAASIDLNSLIAAQFLTGAVWGVLFMSGISASIYIGRGGYEGKVVGSWFSVLALSAVIRVALVVGGVNGQADMYALIEFLPGISWTMATVLLFITWYYYRRYESERRSVED